ncbi:MAG: hypothetical protein M1816_005448 [Peltula sp. TS41687]|nr:MAG: hypothetical protein M1816_005448 [Peltula sp. TS41687]
MSNGRPGNAVEWEKGRPTEDYSPSLPPSRSLRLSRAASTALAGRIKTAPLTRGEITILDAGWDGPVQLSDPVRSVVAPRRSGQITTWRSDPGSFFTGAKETHAFYPHHGSFPFDNLPSKIGAMVISIVLERRQMEAWNVWAVSRRMRDIVAHVGKSYLNRDESKAIQAGKQAVHGGDAVAAAFLHLAERRNSGLGIRRLRSTGSGSV